MAQDTLSEVLRTVRLRGVVFYFMRGGTEWAAEAPPAVEVAAAVLPGAEHVMEYHVVTKGEGWAALPGEPAVRLRAGDIVMFPHGDRHLLSSAPGLRPMGVDTSWMREHRLAPKPIPVAMIGHEGDAFDPRVDSHANIACGFLGFDLRPFNPLLAALPRLLHVPAAEASDGLVALLRQAIESAHAGRPGSDVVLERLSEMLFVDAIRRYVDQLPPEHAGWLPGLRDRYVGKALALLHADPAKPWTIESLAAAVGLSRSAFFDRFVAYIGQPPMLYLANWRMQVAADALRSGSAPVAAVALDVGYESEAAFARAFKRATGSPPATWRRERRLAASP